jgi:hypothetical protein
MNYTPAIRSAEPKRRFGLGDYQAVLFGDIVPTGPIAYLFILVVYDPENRPCFFVAAEVNSMASLLGGGSHFLGVFDSEGHSNLGDSNDWADPEKFAAEALRLARAKFGPSA